MAHYEKLTASRLEEAINIDLKQADKDELKANLGSTDYVSAILNSIEVSEETFIMVNDENSIIGVFGISRDDERTWLGYPWMLTTDELDVYSIKFLRQSKEMVNEWAIEFSLMCNFVSSKNAIALRWLTWLGFTVDMSKDVYLDDPETPFYSFWLKNV